MENFNLGTAADGLRRALGDLSLALFEMQVAAGPLSMSDLRTLVSELDAIKEVEGMLNTTIVRLVTRHSHNETSK